MICYSRIIIPADRGFQAGPTSLKLQGMIVGWVFVSLSLGLLSYFILALPLSLAVSLSTTLNQADLLIKCIFSLL